MPFFFCPAKTPHAVSDSTIEAVADAAHGYVGADLAAVCRVCLFESRKGTDQPEHGEFSQGLTHVPCRKLALRPLLARVGVTRLKLLCWPMMICRRACRRCVGLRTASGLRDRMFLFRVRKPRGFFTGQVRPSGMREVQVEVPRVLWADIGGQEEAKQQLREAVEWPLRHPDAFRRLGIR